MAPCGRALTRAPTGLLPHPRRYLNTEAGYDLVTVTGVRGSSNASEELRRYSGLVGAPDELRVQPPFTRITVTFTSDESVEGYGFVMAYRVVASLAPPPMPPRPPPPAVDFSDDAIGTNDGLCDVIFELHSGSYLMPGGGWITNDYAARRAAAGLSGDGSTAAPALPALPSGSPAVWLRPYTASTSCTWTLNISANAVATFFVE